MEKFILRLKNSKMEPDRCSIVDFIVNKPVIRTALLGSIYSPSKRCIIQRDAPSLLFFPPFHPLSGSKNKREALGSILSVMLFPSSLPFFLFHVVVSASGCSIITSLSLSLFLWNLNKSVCSMSQNLKSSIVVVQKFEVTREFSATVVLYYLWHIRNVKLGNNKDAFIHLSHPSRVDNLGNLGHVKNQGFFCVWEVYRQRNGIVSHVRHPYFGSHLPPLAPSLDPSLL